MKVIIESGATKSDWRVLDSNGTQIRQFHKAGTNVSAMQLGVVQKTLAEAIGQEGLSGARGIYLYTAGVVTGEIRKALSSCIRECAPEADIDIQDDLMGAARGACGHDSGIVAILGTGSNTCFYDGVSVYRKVYSGGYVIGDDGSGAALGKLFLADFIKSLVPGEIADAFSARFDSSYPAIVEGVYRSASPSGYLGSIAPFLLENYGNPSVKELVDGNFRAFIRRSLLKYETSNYPVGIVGGFGWACKDILNPLLAEEGIRVSRFLKAPVDGLCGYHAQA